VVVKMREGIFRLDLLRIDSCCATRKADGIEINTVLRDKNRRCISP
jgi:hypothetical protein